MAQRLRHLPSGVTSRRGGTDRQGSCRTCSEQVFHLSHSEQIVRQLFKEWGPPLDTASTRAKNQSETILASPSTCLNKPDHLCPIPAPIPTPEDGLRRKATRGVNQSECGFGSLSPFFGTLSGFTNFAAAGWLLTRSAWICTGIVFSKGFERFSAWIRSVSAPFPSALVM